MKLNKNVNQKNSIFKNWLVILVAILFIILPFIINAYWVDVLFFFGVYALLGLSLNIVLGEVGLFDLGHMGFMAIGAYTTAILNITFGIPIIVLLPISAIAAGAFAWLVCSPIIHLRGDYLCIVTIGMGEIVRLTLNNNPFGITGGPNGVFGIDFPSLGNIFVVDNSTKFYYYIWIIVGLTIIGLVNLQHSRIGRAWNCIREDEIAAEATGIDVRYYKLLAFVLGAGLAGVAGNIYATNSIPGVLIGAAAISLFPEFFRTFALYRMLIFGAAMVAMMVFRPGGIWPRKRGATEFESLLMKAGEENG